MEDGIRIGAAASALGGSIDTLRRWETAGRGALGCRLAPRRRGGAAGRLPFERRGQQRYLSHDELARLLRERSGVASASARNRLTGIVLAVRRDGVMAQVDIACGPHRVVSVMSREAADQLGLKPGDSATAVIKATTVAIERS